MTELAAPAAKRLQRPSWRDSRLLVGVLLVLLAATLGARAVASADDTEPYYVAAQDLVPGDRTTAASFRRVDVRLADGLGGYLRADAPPPEGRYVLRDIRPGELVPVSALGAGDAVDVQRVTLHVDAESTVGLVKGSHVDVYATPKAATGTDVAARPRTAVLLDDVAVSAVLTTGGGLGSSSQTSIQVLVPSDQVQEVVAVVDAEARITVVPAAGSGQ